jgi:hypothetical protein
MKDKKPYAHNLSFETVKIPQPYQEMGYDEEAKEWVPNAESRRRQYEEEKANECSECGENKRSCWC